MRRPSRPMDHFIRCDPSGDLGQFMIIGGRKHADITIGRAQLQLHQKAQNILLRLQGDDAEIGLVFIVRLGDGRGSPRLWIFSINMSR